MSSVFDFEGRTALVTGAGAGIGARIAVLLLEGGATVFAVDIDFSGAPDGVVRVAADVSNREQMLAAAEAAAAKTGRIDALINNAAVLSFTDVLQATEEEFDRTMAVNVKGVFLGMKAVLPHMLAAGRGAIVNVASVAANVGIPDRASYSASKGAVVSLTRQVAVQYAASGVRCNCLCPGSTDSPMVAEIVAKAADPLEARRVIEQRQPIGRLAQPEEIADAAVYLASDRSSFVTGVILNVDGGWTAR